MESARIYCKGARVALMERGTIILKMMKEWRGSMKKCIMLVFILALGMFIIVACGDKTTKSDVSDADGAVTDAPVDNTDMDKIGGDICPIS